MSAQTNERADSDLLPWVQDLDGLWHRRPAGRDWLQNREDGANAETMCGVFVPSVHVANTDPRTSRLADEDDEPTRVCRPCEHGPDDPVAVVTEESAAEVPPIVFVDTETTGVGPDRVPWEIGIIRRAADGEVAERRWFLPIDDVSRVEGFALRVGGFWDRHPWGLRVTGRFPDGDVRNAWTLALSHPRAVARELMAMTHGATWVGANPAFDAQLVEQLLRQHGLQPTWDYHLVDVNVLALGYLHARAEAGRGERPAQRFRSQDLIEAVGVEPASEEDRHTALGDARWVMRQYDAITGAAPTPVQTQSSR